MQQKQIEDSISVLKSKKKLERIVNLRKAVVSIKGVTGQTKSPQTPGKGPASGPASNQDGEMGYGDRIGAEIHNNYACPDLGDKNLEMRVSIEVEKDGLIVLKKVEKKSGNRLFNKCVLQAIERTARVTPPPNVMEIEIRFTP